MFEGRFGELLIIGVLALIFLGPEKLPRVVAEVGRWVGRARAMARQFREQLEEEVQLEETRKAQAARPQPTPQAPGSPETSAGSPEHPVDVGAALNPAPEATPESREHESEGVFHPEAAAFHPESTADLQSPPPELWSQPETPPPSTPPPAHGPVEGHPEAAPPSSSQAHRDEKPASVESPQPSATPH